MTLFIKLPYAVLLLSVSVHCIKPKLLELLLNLAAPSQVDGPIHFQKEPRDEPVIYKEYDFIVIGAGTAGCAVANRLSEISDWKVLLIEAGGEENFLMDIPLFASALQLSSANWNYKTEPSETYCLGMEKKQCHWPRGRVMGGSSILNYMVFTRGNRRDYDQWEALGNKGKCHVVFQDSSGTAWSYNHDRLSGWGWRDVLPYFKKLENMKIPQLALNKEYHGTDGYVTVSDVPYKSPIAEAFVQAGQFWGQPIVDYNGPTQTGFNYFQVTMQNGTRHSSSRAYLHPINRPNLHVKKRSMVTKILIDPKTKTATGVEFMTRTTKFVVKAKKEVILSGGTINSAQLLMLSGIGPKDHLEEKKIKVIQDLKVGYNLRDHIATAGLTYLIDCPFSLITRKIMSNINDVTNYLFTRKGPMSVPAASEALAFIDLSNMNNPDGYPDIELLLYSVSLANEDTLPRNLNLKESLYQEYFNPIKGKESFMILPMTLRPKSVGRIMLKDKNPFRHPLIYPNYYSDPEGHDIRRAVAGIRLANELVKTPAFKKLGSRFYSRPLPPCKNFEYDSDAYWDCYTRHFTLTIYHHGGTCKMGPDSDPDAVVDERLRVRGIKKLRVIDASIMPLLPAAHLNGPTFMIAEKGSDMIKEDWGHKCNIIR